VPTQTRTVVFTDIADYTASVGRTDREGLRNLIAAHEQTVRPVVETYRGRVVKNLGDSFMALFPAATDAARFGLELVDLVSGGGAFSMRVAMATGDVEEIDGDAFGESANLASRILSKTPPGEVWLSLGTQISMNQSEIPWEPVGRYALKGIAGEQEIFRAVPRNRCWLPDSLVQGLRTGKLVRIKAGDRPPLLPPEPVILLEGFTPGSEELKRLLDTLPVIDSTRLWLSASRIALSDRIAWLAEQRGLVIGLPEALEKALQESKAPLSSTSGSDTIILDVAGMAVLEVILAGLALPAVPMSQVVASYTYDLLPDGRWVNKSDNAIARVETVQEKVTIAALVPGLSVGGRQVAPGSVVELADGAEIRTPAGPIQYRELKEKGYMGILFSDTLSRLGIAPGQQAEIGREPNHPGLALPDRRGQDNIRWCVGSRAARARESGFTLDRALAGRRQAALVMGPSGATVIGLHERCPTFVMNGQGLERVQSPRAVSPGEFIVTGTSVVAVREPAS
jgi:hypothetical protein